MAPRSSWKGYLRLSLVSVPVQAFNAAVSGGGEIHLNQLHAECHSRIRYKKFCPIHGEVANSEIISGYEHAKGQYVIVEDDEVDKLRSNADRAINIDTFVTPETVDPMYFDGRTYYLTPDGPMGQKPYAVLLQALLQEQRWAIGQAVFSGREQLVLVRPMEGVLLLEMLHYHNQVRQKTTFSEEVDLPAVSKEELRLASKLIEASSSDNLDLAKYQDEYTNKMRQLIEAKVAGKEVVGPAQDDETPVINLMDALRRSVAQKSGGAHKTPSRPAKKTAESAIKATKPRKSSRRAS